MGIGNFVEKSANKRMHWAVHYPRNRGPASLLGAWQPVASV